jgi:autotransporter translocation and assembly factor TamB
MLQRRISPAKNYARRTLQIVALVGTLLVGILALALIVSQTPWFRDWLRRFVVREAKQYVNGDVSIGSLGGDLFYGVQLADVAIDVNGEHIVTLKRLEIKYSIAELVSQGMTVRQIRLDEPFVLLRHDAAGWNVSRLVKRQQQEANRQGPGKPVSLPDIEIVHGRVAVDDRAPSPTYRIPKRIDALNAKAAFAYAPVHYSLTLNQLSFSGSSPALTVTRFTGGIATRDDDLNVQKIVLQTASSSVTVDGVVHNYTGTPSRQLTASAHSVSLPEFAGVLPVLQGYNLHPAFDAKAEGPLDRLRLALDAKSEAGAVNGSVTLDLQAPDIGATGTVDVAHLNLAPIVKSPSQRSDITGRATLDLRMAGSAAPARVHEQGAGAHPASPAVIDRLRGRIVFAGPSVAAAGYRASDVRLTANLSGRRIELDGRANAYGGSATAKGAIVIPGPAGQPTRIDLAGQASHINLAGLPRQINAPRIATNLNATAYHVTGTFGRSSAVEGTTTLGQSTIAGGTIVGGTTAQFALRSRTPAPGSRRGEPGGLESLSYAARGEVRGLNLQRVGTAFQIAALAKPEYDSRVNSQFDVKGSGTTIDRMQLDATGAATDSQVFDATIPAMAYEAHLANGALKGHAKGSFNGLDPARVSGNQRIAGHMSGTVDAGFGLANLSGPVTPDAVSADGQITLTNSDIAGLRIDAADIQGQYQNRRGTLRQATVKGPDLDVQASGPIALDDAGQSNLKYHVDATNLASLGKLANQPVAGAVALDGTLTGNAASLKTSGTLDGSNLAYQSDKALDLHSTYNVTVPNLQFAHAQLQAQTRGTFVQIGSIQLNTLTASTTYADQKLDFQTHLAEAPAGGQLEAAAGQKSAGARELDATGTVIFHPDHQEIHLPSLAVRTQGVEWKTAPGSQAAVQYGQDRIQVQGVRLVNGVQSLDVDGAVSRGDNPNLEGISVVARHVDISQLERLALQNRGFTGTLDANAKLAGSIKSPEITGHVAVTNGGFQQFKYQSLTADGGYDGNRITLDARLVQSPGVELTAKGTAPITALRANPPGVTGHIEAAPGEGIDVHVQSSNIDLGIVQGFTSQLTNVTGTLQADFRVTGSGYDPHLNGYIDVRNGGFGVVEAGTSYTGMTTRIELEPDRIHVPRFEIRDQHGDQMVIQGDLAVHERQAGAVNVSLESNAFKVIDNELGKLSVDAHLRLTGAVRRPRLEGDVQFEAARLELDQILQQFAQPYSTEALPDVVSAEDTMQSDKGADEATRDALARGRELSAAAAPKQNATAPETPAAKTGVFSALQLDVHLVAPGNLVIRGNDLRPGGPAAAQVGNVNATIGTDLRIQKQVDGPITIRGTATTVRGFYEFQGRRFTIDRDGTLQFHGLAQINPDVDVSAERLIPNTGVTAKIHITGTARAPQLSLSSDPAGLDEADILSLIVFNQQVNELGTGERASLAETAGGIASGFVASSLGRSIGKALDVDLFEITTSDPETGENAGGVTLGKQVSDKAFVRFRQQFGQRSFSEFMLEYQLTKFLRLDTTISPETSGVANRLTQRRVERAGVDLIFFFSY